MKFKFKDKNKRNKANQVTKIQSLAKKHLPKAQQDIIEDMKLTTELTKRVQEIFEYLDSTLTKIEKRLENIENKLK